MSRTQASHKPTILQKARENARRDAADMFDQLRAKHLRTPIADFEKDRLARRTARKHFATMRHWARDAGGDNRPGTMGNQNALVSVGGTPSKKQTLKAAHEAYKPGGAGYKAARARFAKKAVAPKTKVAIDLPGARKTIAKKPLMKRH